MRVFLDTNVLLSALFGRGLCAQLLETLLREKVETLVDAQVLSEFERVARSKLRVNREDLALAMAFLQRHCVIATSTGQPAPGVPDPDDAPIIANAIEAGATWFVTGDKAVLAMGAAQDMPIIAPREAYQRLRGLA